MASKTIDHLALTVGVTPYEHEGNSYDALRVSVIYSKGYGFYVSWQPVKLTQYGYQTGPMPSQDPLVGGGRFIVDRVPKNNSKRLTEMHAALELAQEGIALYFDLRLWTQMEDFMRYVALYGFTEHYRQQVENLKAAAAVAPVMRQYNELKKKNPDALLLFRCGDFYEAYEQDANDVVNILGTALSKSRAAGNAYDMVGFPHYALDAYLPKLVRAGKRVAICDQINENTNEKTLEDKTMTTKNNQENESVQTAQVNNNVTTEADVQEVDDIVPKVTAKPKAKPAEKPATTIPLGKHGTLVIAGVGGTKADGGSKTEDVPQTSDIRHQTSAKVQDSVPQGKLQYVTYEVKKVNKATKKEYTVTGSKIVGFELTDPIYLAGPSFNGAIHTEQQDGKTVGVLRFSHKWTPAVKEVCDKLNAGGTIEDCVAIITGAKDARWQRIQERIAKREERKAQREAAKPKPAGEPAGAVAATGEKQYTLDEVAQMLGKLLPEVAEKKEELKALLKAA